MTSFSHNHAVGVDIDDYHYGIPRLCAAVNDAQCLAEILEREHGYQVHLLVEEVTKVQFEPLFAESLEVGPDDRLLVYFAGHGIALDSNDGPAGYLIPQDARPEDSDTSLPMAELHNWLDALQGCHLPAVLNFCFAGALRRASTRHVGLLPEVIHHERYERFVRDPAWQVVTLAAYHQQALDVLSGEVLDQRSEAERPFPFALALFEALGRSTALADLVTTWSQAYAGCKLLLVVDQLEELLTLCQDKRERAQFLTLLAGAAGTRSQYLPAVVTLRTDFEPQFAEDTPLAALWDGARYVVPPLDHDDLREVIGGPASVRVLCFEPNELVDELMKEVIQTPGALPLAYPSPEPSGKPLIDAWMSLNECLPDPASDAWLKGSEEDRVKLKAKAMAFDCFQVGFRERLQEEGLEAVALNFGAGNFQKAEHYIDWLPETLKSYTYLGFHEYSWPTLFPDEDRGSESAAGLYRDCVAGIKKAFPGREYKVIITEAGMARMYHHAKKADGDVGWLFEGETLSQEDYWESMKWYNEHMVQDDYVMGACLFNVGPTDLWRTFRHLGKDNDGNPLTIVDRMKGLGVPDKAMPAAPPPPVTLKGRGTTDNRTVAGAMVRLVGSPHTLRADPRASSYDPGASTWTQAVTGFEGNVWTAWRKFVAPRAASITYSEFKAQVAQYNPSLDENGGRFVADKSYLLPRNAGQYEYTRVSNTQRSHALPASRIGWRGFRVAMEV